MQIKLGDPVNVKLLLCKECGIHTNHHKTPSGAWVCWCGAVHQSEPTYHPVPMDPKVQS
jgi:ribosomal protein L37AE/L43A